MAGDPPPNPSWGEKVLEIHSAMERNGVPHAFGGAIALNYHREPRTTLDIDINVFLAPEERTVALDALEGLYPIADRDGIERELLDSGQGRTLWNETFVDLFFSNTPFHDAMAERTTKEVFGDAEIPILSIEDLLVCKVLFDRGRDWVDIEAVLRTGGETLDNVHIDHWLNRFLVEDDPRLMRLTALREQSAADG